MRSDITCAHYVYMQHYKQQWSTVQITACSVFPTYTHKLHCMEWWVQVHVYMYSRHQKKIPVLQNETDGFVVENGKRTDTKRIAHGYRKERPVPFCFPFRSVYFLFVRSIPFTTCAPLFNHSRYSWIFDATLSATRGPVQFNLRVRLLHTRCSANLLFSQSPTCGPVQFN